MSGPARAEVVVRTARLALVALPGPDLVAVRDRVRAVLVDDGAWAPDYPTDGDVLMAGLSLRHDAVPTAGAPWGPLQVRLLRGPDAVDVAVGGIGFKTAPDVAGVVEVGYGLAPSVHGTGLATEALAGMLDLARRLGLRAVTAETAATNVASRRVLEKNGFGLVGTEDDGMLWWRRDL
ncbi:MAG: GNAT family N-acetyltransferase [Actinobacteria bacterium]|nr:GNAT family N-acetyltransferase [Actinomycetota bacterium]